MAIGIVLATLSAAVSVAPAAVELFDGFDDNVLSTAKWEGIVTGSGPSLAEANQRLELTLPANAAETGAGLFEAKAQSVCKLHGDFDIQADYQLLTWPASNGARVGLGAGGVTIAHRSSESGQEYYVTDFNGSVQRVTTSHTSGKFRVTRVGSTGAGYYWSNNSWVQIGSATVGTGDASFLLAGWSHNYLFADQQVKVAFDNMSLEGTLVCPPALSLYDDFSDNTLDAAKWKPSTSGSGPSLAETNERLEFTMPASSVETGGGSFGANYESRCKLSGDFDVQVDYTMLTWPGTNGARLGLYAGGGLGVVHRSSGIGQENYVTDFSGRIRSIATSHTGGKFRLIRRGSAATGYFWDNGAWVFIDSTTVTTADVVFGLNIWSHNNVFWDKLVKAAFDNVRVSGTLACSATQPANQTYGVQGGSLGQGSLALAPSAVAADPVNTLTGAFTHTETDLSLASSGVPFELTRSYTSADTASGRFGPGWTDNYQASLTVQANGDIVAKGDEGQRVTFTSLGAGAFAGQAGTRATLTTISGGYRLTTNDQLSYEFNSSGKLLSKKDRNGQGVTLAYDGSSRLATVTDSAAQAATFSYNASNLVSGVSLPDGRSVAYGYASGRLSSYTDARGKTWSYTYDAGGRLATIVDPLNHTEVTNVYDQTSGRITSQTDARGKTTGFAWDAATQTATITDPNNRAWKDVYANNVLIKQITPAGAVTELGHDPDLNTTAVTSPNGSDTTKLAYQNGNLVTATAPSSLGSVQKTLTYDAQNNVKTVTDARGKVTQYGYDTAGNNTSVTLDGQQVFGATYNAQGQMLTSTDGNGKQTSYTYDTNGNVASVTAPDPDGPGPLGPAKTSYTYDAAGNVLSRVDPSVPAPAAPPPTTPRPTPTTTTATCSPRPTRSATRRHTSTTTSATRPASPTRTGTPPATPTTTRITCCRSQAPTPTARVRSRRPSRNTVTTTPATARA